MINLISSIAIVTIIILPFLIKGIFRFTDYFGYIMGIRYLIINGVAQIIFNFIIPAASSDKNRPTQPIEELDKLTFQERCIKWSIEFLHSIIGYFILYYCIIKISKPTQNYNLIFLFISGTCIQYIFSFCLYMFLPALSKNEKFTKIITEQKINPKYFSEEYAYESLFKTIFQILNDTGICLIMMLYLKKLIPKRICFLNYFLPIIIRFLIICVGLKFLDSIMNLFYAIPFTCGIYYYFKKIKSGELSNRYKDENVFE